MTFRSPLIDLKGKKQVSAIRRRADTSLDTWVEMRSRTSNEVRYDITYYDKNGKEVTERKWNKLIPSFKGPVDTTLVPRDDQSPWSNVYLTPDQRFQSPSPRRYMELEVSLVSENPAGRRPWTILRWSSTSRWPTRWWVRSSQLRCCRARRRSFRTSCGLGGRLDSTG